MKVVLSEAELMQKKGEYTTNCCLNMQQYSYCPPEQSVAATQTPTRCSRNMTTYPSSQFKPPDTNHRQKLENILVIKSIYMSCYTIWSTQEPLPVG